MTDAYRSSKKTDNPRITCKRGGRGLMIFLFGKGIFFIVSLQANISNTYFDQKSSGHPKVGVSKITQEMGGGG